MHSLRPILRTLRTWAVFAILWLVLLRAAPALAQQDSSESFRQGTVFLCWLAAGLLLLAAVRPLVSAGATTSAETRSPLADTLLSTKQFACIDCTYHQQLRLLETIVPLQFSQSVVGLMFAMWICFLRSSGINVFSTPFCAHLWAAGAIAGMFVAKVVRATFFR